MVSFSVFGHLRIGDTKQDAGSDTGRYRRRRLNAPTRP